MSDKVEDCACWYSRGEYCKKCQEIIFSRQFFSDYGDCVIGGAYDEFSVEDLYRAFVGRLKDDFKEEE